MNDSVYKSPAYQVLSVPIEKVVPNTYNPNAVAPPEMRLLYDSIKEDGYTMPIVCYYSKAQDVYVIVDGFHRYRIMLDHKDIYQRENGKLPVTVIDKPLSNRMASTIRHNRARGNHDVDLMSNIVKELHTIGRSDAWISKHMGMSRDEILRLKQITGLTELFRDVKFGQAWKPVEEPVVQKANEEEEEKLPEDLEESKDTGEVKNTEKIK
ncbi:MAG: ParB-like nuclease domain-containing protein [Lachnospiraceae bacterium]|nr:ParB-like nuclease domain-containing protein [Lachnospiraceae bacterium]